MNAKSLLQSKTFWVQVIAFLAALFPVVQAWISKNPETTIAVLGAVNVLVRFATSGRIVLFGSGETESNTGNSGASGGNVPLWLVAGATAVLMGGLPSCSPALVAAARAVPIRIGVETDYGNAAYSSKRGIEVDAVIRAEK